MADRIRVLFLCMGNSCRSQIAEGWARRLVCDRIEAYSAGLAVYGLNRVAVRVMEEAGVDIAHYRSKRVAELGKVRFDFVITLCGRVQQRRPTFSDPTPVLHAEFDDPMVLAASARSEEEGLNHYRRIRDEIRAFVETLPDRLRQLAENEEV